MARSLVMVGPHAGGMHRLSAAAAPIQVATNPVCLAGLHLAAIALLLPLPG